LLAPSLLTAVPRTIAQIRSPSRCACDSRLITMTPPPSPRPKPLAFALNVLQRPSGARPPNFEQNTIDEGASTRLTPPTSASGASPLRTLCAA
jgi:hypothetical protein